MAGVMTMLQKLSTSLRFETVATLFSTKHASRITVEICLCIMTSSDHRYVELTTRSKQTMSLHTIAASLKAAAGPQVCGKIYTMRFSHHDIYA